MSYSAGRKHVQCFRPVPSCRNCYISPRMRDHDNSVRVAGTTEAPVRPAPDQWVHRYGDCLFRHAQARVGQREVAEDLVQDVFVAAWKSRDQFAGRSSEKTWLMRILRNKIVDYYRRRRIEMEIGETDELRDLEEKQFHSGWNGTHWRKGAAPRSWANPRQCLERLEFWNVVEECTSKLPRTTAQVFLLREMDGMASEEICCELNVKPAHFFVLIHRARLALRRCLEVNWFRNKSSTVSDAT